MTPSTPYDPENPFRAAASGNGSVRNLPRPSRSNSASNRSLTTMHESPNRSSHIDENSERSIMEKNKKDFEDVEATGKWGSISRNEVICVATTVILVLGGVVTVILLLVVGHESSGAEMSMIFSEAPSMAPSGPISTFTSAMDEYMHLKAALERNAFTNKIVLPQNASHLRALSQYEDDPYVSAAAWLMFKDPSDAIDGMVERFAAVSLYYSWMGDTWTDYTDWLVPTLHICDWKGVSCAIDEEGLKVVTGITLNDNNLMGTLAPTLALLDRITSLSLNGNSLTGNIPGDLIGSLQKLIVLELQNNLLTGQIPFDLRGKNLESLHLEGNAFYGTWPFCDAMLANMTLDCDLLACSCCDTQINCISA